METPARFWLGFNNVIKKLQQDQKLVIKVTESMPSVDEAKEKELALQFVKEDILKSFFSATLKSNDDSNPQAKSASNAILDSLIASDKKEGEKGGLLPCASLEIKLVRMEETKSLNFNYTSSKAISQSAVPQNFIGSDILHAKKTAPYFIQVNINDPFFQQLDLTVLGPDNFEEYGIKAAIFNIHYNDKVYTADPFVADDSKWTKRIARSSDKNALFHVTSEFAFKSAASSGWEGNSSYQLQSKSASTLLNMDPGSVLTFNEISILFDRKFSWENYNQVLVELNYRDDKGSKKTKKYSFTSSKHDSQIFKYRYLTEKPWVVNYKLIYFLVGGETVERDGSENPPAIIISNLA
ncbi:hypothetical protein [Chromobacterium alticapitis]|uniref:hypothetical protein n=1 Tax=Chromobacterium alticapitis TaxID=2073169 RepID=UPI0018EDB857|nr:hypothetical protein [Chromobacterium alticapitis]